MAYRFHSEENFIQGDYVVCGSDSDIGDLFGSAGGGDGASISTWVYLYSNGEDQEGVIASKDIDDTKDDYEGWALRVHWSKEFVFYHAFSGTNGIWGTTGDAAQFGEWFHLVVTYDNTSVSNNVVFYLNSVLKATEVGVAPTGTAKSDAENQLTIGSWLAFGGDFDGLISDWRFYDHVLTAEEVMELFVKEGSDDLIDGCVRRFPMTPEVTGRAPTFPLKDSATSSEDETSNFTVTVPDNIDGDTLVAVVCAAGDTSGDPPDIDTPSGWTQRMHVDLASAPSHPTVAIYTRSASSEPSTYTWTDDQGDHPWAAIMLNMGGMTDVPDSSDSSTGTTDSPISPSITPSDNSVVIRVACMDDDFREPPIPGYFFPTDSPFGVDVVSVDGPGINGCSMGVALETNDGTATGTKTWTARASDQWAALTIAFLHGDGVETFPCQDISSNLKHARIWGKVTGDADLLSVEGS